MTDRKNPKVVKVQLIAACASSSAVAGVLVTDAGGDSFLKDLMAAVAWRALREGAKEAVQSLLGGGGWYRSRSHVLRG